MPEGRPGRRNAAFVSPAGTGSHFRKGGCRMAYFLDSRKVAEATSRLLEERGVSLDDIARLVYFLQKDYIADLTLDLCRENVEKVLAKREVQNAVLTGIQLDMLAER